MNYSNNYDISELDYYSNIIEFFQNPNANKETIELWKDKSFIELMKVLERTSRKEFVKNAILVVRPETSMNEAVIGGIQEMNQAKIKIRGVIANAAEIQKSYYYRYRYGYGYGYESGDKKRSSDKKRLKVAETSV